MPDAQCPTCREWSPRQDWSDAPGQRFAFIITCRECGAEIDVHDIGFRMTVSPSMALPGSWAAGQERARPAAE